MENDKKKNEDALDVATEEKKYNDLIEIFFQKNEENNVKTTELVDVLEKVQDDVIMNSRIPLYYKRYFLRIKHHLDMPEFLEQCCEENGRLLFKELVVLNLKGKRDYQIDVLNIGSEYLELEGRMLFSEFEKKLQFYVKNGKGEQFIPEIVRLPAYDVLSPLGEPVFWGYKFAVRLPLVVSAEYQFFLKDAYSNKEHMIFLKFNAFAHLNEQLMHCYFVKDKWICSYCKQTIFLTKNTLLARLRFEKKLCEEIEKKYPNDARQIIKLRRDYFRRMFFRTKERWLISDRAYRAGDNGEVFFAFVSGKKKINAKFLLDKNSEDYSRIKEIGQVVSYGTYEHQLEFLLADKLISSSADGWVFRMDESLHDCVKDLFHFQYVFLQHGITQKDLSKWLNKCSKNIRIFVTAARDEYTSICKGAYGYTEREVKLTGFARYDRLENHREKKIVIMPTWRKGIAPEHVKSEQNAKIMVRGYSSDFVQTEYYHFYQGLINDPQFCKALKDYGYQCEFYLHPSFEGQINDFSAHTDEVIIHKGEIDYPQVFAEGALMITDYSSVAMDFAYLKKPVIYSQFDIKVFLNQHTGKAGYFEYEKIGFGDVCYDLKSTIEKSIEYMKDGCEMTEFYKDRVDRFFAYTDHGNCERIYKEISSIGRE